MDTKESLPRRPLLLSLVLVWDGLAAGLLPLALTLLAFFNEETRTASGLTWTGLLPSVLLAGAILAAAVLAWRGSNIGRIGLIVLVGLHYGLLAIRYFALLAGPEGFDWLVFWRGLRAVLWIVINTWYLNSRHVREFIEPE